MSKCAKFNCQAQTGIDKLYCQNHSPETQSVCKHCGEAIVWNGFTWLHLGGSQCISVMRVAEPASTGEPPPSAKEFWAEYYKSDPNFPPSEAACDFAEAYASRTFWKRWAEENTKIVKHWPGWKRIEQPARPSEPSAPGPKDAVSDQYGFGTTPERPAPQTSAEQEAVKFDKWAETQTEFDAEELKYSRSAVLAYVADLKAAAPQPSYMTCTECGMKVCDHIVKRLAGTGCPEGKVEGVWLLECDWHDGQGFQPFGECFYDSEEEANAARLHFKIPKDYRAVKYGPYFPPASQTVEKWPDYLPATGMGAVAAIMNLWLREFRSSPTAEQIRDATKIIDSLLATPASTARTDGWKPIETAPKNGRHIQAADFSGKGVGFGGNPPQSYQCVVHWWEWCDGTHQEEWGWYPSTGAGESNALTNLTHWRELDEPAAPGSVPPHDPEKDFRDKCIGNWEGVPQAEPPK